MKQKILSYIAYAATALPLGGVGGGLLTSCNMDQTPFSEVTAKNYVKDTQTVNTLMTGCYNALHDVMYYEWAVTELRTSNARNYGTGSTSNNTKLVEQLDWGTITPEHEWVDNYWKACYATIARANSVLAFLDKADGDEAQQRQYEGEARFLRALEYFNLVRLWGPVFIVETTTPSSVARNMQRSSVADVYALIERDLEAIVNGGLLPEQLPDAQTGRATLLAAKALLAKVYATHYRAGQTQYARAAELCREVLQSTAVGNPQTAADLVAYDQVFSTSNEMNREIIFAVRYTTGNQGLGSPFGNLFAPINNGANVITGTANGFNTPSDNIIKAYDAADRRLDVNIAQRYYNSTTGQWVTTGNCRYCRKYTTPVTTAFDGESDWPVIRVADVALLYAELTNELSGPTAQALDYLNMVRERAGLAAYGADELTGKYDFRMAVRQERRLELAFENQYWFDLLRWGTAVETVNAYFASETFYQGYNHAISPIKEWQVLLPVPVSVLNINPDVAQNPGY